MNSIGRHLHELLEFFKFKYHLGHQLKMLESSGSLTYVIRHAWCPFTGTTWWLPWPCHKKNVKKGTFTRRNGKLGSAEFAFGLDGVNFKPNPPRSVLSNRSRTFFNFQAIFSRTRFPFPQCNSNSSDSRRFPFPSRGPSIFKASRSRLLRPDSGHSMMSTEANETEVVRVELKKTAARRRFGEGWFWDLKQWTSRGLRHSSPPPFKTFSQIHPC